MTRFNEVESSFFFSAGSWAGEGTWRWFLAPRSAP